MHSEVPTTTSTADALNWKQTTQRTRITHKTSAKHPGPRRNYLWVRDNGRTDGRRTHTHTRRRNGVVWIGYYIIKCYYACMRWIDDSSSMWCVSVCVCVWCVRKLMATQFWVMWCVQTSQWRRLAKKRPQFLSSTTSSLWRLETANVQCISEYVCSVFTIHVYVCVCVCRVVKEPIHTDAQIQIRGRYDDFCANWMKSRRSEEDERETRFLAILLFLLLLSLLLLVLLVVLCVECIAKFATNDQMMMIRLFCCCFLHFIHSIWHTVTGCVCLLFSAGKCGCPDRGQQNGHWHIALFARVGIKARARERKNGQSLNLKANGLSTQHGHACVCMCV